jgi:long-subunit fatty acid transport protein
VSRPGVRFLCLAVAWFAAAALAHAAGTTGANGIKLSAGARPEGMGGAFVGVADDISAIFWNPAGLSMLGSQEGSFMHTAYLAETS